MQKPLFCRRHVAGNLLVLYREKTKHVSKRDERVCEVCNVIESEYHVLMICPRFINERTERLPECMLTNPSEENFISMLKSKAMNVQLHLGLLCLDVQKQHLNYI